MAYIWINKNFEIEGEMFEVDYDLHVNLNNLARKFYLLHEHEVCEGFDFFKSDHPQENLMYTLAMNAYVF